MSKALKPWIVALAIGIVVGLAFDAFVLNYQTLISRSFEEVEPTHAVYAEGVKEGEIAKSKPIEYVFDDADIGNMHISLTPEAQKKYGRDVVFDVYAIDEGSAVYYYLGPVSMKTGDQYVHLHLTGNASRIKLATDTAAVLPVTVEFNVPRPYKPNWLFVAGSIIAALFICLMRTNSHVYRKLFDSSKAFLVIVTVVVVVVSCGITSYKAATMNMGTAERQYYELAQALAEGHVYLDAEPSDELLAMDNPYDRNLREETKVTALWDHALYSGKYYVYFGILPCLMYFLPYYLITGGAEFPVAGATLITMAILCFGLIKFSLSICRRWFPGCSQATFIYIVTALVAGSWIAYSAIRPGHYALPILLGLALLIWGIALIIDATARRNIKTGRAVLGATLLGLIIACRPQLLLGGLIAIILLVQHMREYGVARDLKPLVLAIIPVAAIFALQGWYNYIRFDSFFDFGANYNLTTNDMTKRGYDIDRTPAAILFYFFEPPSVNVALPFFRGVDTESYYYGVSITEKMLGGIFWLTPLLLPIFTIVLGRYRRIIGAQKLTLIIVSAICALVLAVFDANGAGILPRYFMDFGFFLAFGSALCIGLLWGPQQNSAKHVSKDETVDVISKEHYLYEEEGKLHYTTAGVILLVCAVATGIIMIMNIPGFGM